MLLVLPCCILICLQVLAGSTGHAECVQVTFDPEVVSYEQLLEVRQQVLVHCFPNF